MFTSVLRRLRRIPRPVVGRDEALRIAQRFARDRDLNWTTPFICERLRSWVVHTASDTAPSPWVIIDNQSGEVIKHGSPPR